MCTAYLIIQEDMLLECVDACIPVFDEGLEVEGEAHAERQKRRVLL